MAKKIMIDAGHFGKNNRSPCLTSPVYYESEMTWKLHLLLKTELEGRGFEVGTTRQEQDKDLSVNKRGKMAKGYDMFISLHSNAVGNGEAVEGTDRPVVIFPIAANEEQQSFAGRIALSIRENMNTAQAWKTYSREGDNGDYYGVIRGAVSVGCSWAFIIEHSFHTDTAATKWLLDEKNLVQLAKSEAEIIEKHFDCQLPTGDVNGDGKVDMTDYMLAKRYVLNSFELTPEQLLRADVNGDGKVDSRDYMMIKRIALGTYNPDK